MGRIWQRYALGGINVFKWQTLDPKRIPLDLYFYFLAPSRLGSDFPFVHLVPSILRIMRPEGYQGPEPVAGVLTNIPFLNLLMELEVFRERKG